ncbi:hypothetical protein ABI59_13050 [Acidobacteria bacterium Mor1]|nr:hypothetical protein ABI59_13050 [Acidobacteria bacterium Mor1]
MRALPADPGNLLFMEWRDDRTTVAGPDGVRSGSRGWTSGLSVRAGLTDPGYAYVAEPRVEDVAAVAAAAVDGTAPLPRGAASPRHHEPPPSAVADWLVRLAAAAGREAPRGFSVRARLVEFDQRILIVADGADPAGDRRVGRRVHLEVRGAAGNRRSVARLDRVLRGDRLPDTNDLEGWASATVERAATRLDAVAPTAGNMPVVFAPGTGGVLVHELIGHALEADAVLEGRSRLARLSTPFDSSMVVIEDPRRGRTPWRIDDEGTPCRATALLRGGRLLSGIHDRRTARLAGAASTGHGRRAGYRDPVLPRLGCTFMAAGTHRPEEGVTSVEQGLFVRRAEAAVADPATGTATLRVTDADQIHEGRLGRSLTTCLLKVKVEDFVNGVDKIASDLAFDTCIGTCVRDGQPLATSVGAPTFRLGVASVVTPKKP